MGQERDIFDMLLLHGIGVGRGQGHSIVAFPALFCVIDLLY